MSPSMAFDKGYVAQLFALLDRLAPLISNSTPPVSWNRISTMEIVGSPYALWECPLSSVNVNVMPLHVNVSPRSKV